MTTNETPRPGVLVWDVPVRVMHALLAVCFAGAWLTAESERWRLLHVTLGWTMAAVVVVRVAWGFVGTRHARFASFVRGPSAALAHLKALLRRQPDAHAGHNPAGALAIVALLMLAAATAASGIATDAGWNLPDDLHEGLATALLALVGLHLAGVAVGSWAGRENLVRAMVTGRKQAPPAQGIRRAWGSVAVVLLAGVLAFWGWQWQGGVAPGIHNQAAASHHADDEDDD